MPRSRRSKDPELRARFLREALEAKRLGLHRHGEHQGRNLPPAQVRRIERQMARLAADGATYREIGDIFGYGTESVSKMLKRGRDNVKIEGVEEGKSDDDDDEEEESEQEPKPKPKVKKSRPGREVYCLRSAGESDFGFRVTQMEDGQFIVTSLRLRSAAARAGVSVGDRVAAYKHASHRDEDASDEESNTSLTRWSRSSLDCINAFPVEQGVVLHVSTARRQRTKDSSKPKTTRRPVSASPMPSLDDAKQLFRAIDAKFGFPVTIKTEKVENNDSSTGTDASKREDNKDMVASENKSRNVQASKWEDDENKPSIANKSRNAQAFKGDSNETKAHDTIVDTKSTSSNTLSSKNDSERNITIDSDLDTEPLSKLLWAKHAKRGAKTARDIFKIRQSVPVPQVVATKHEVNFGPGPNKRDVYLVRLEGEQTMGFSVQDKDGRFRISHVDEGKAADRAGLTVDQWVVSYKLWPMHRVKHVAPIRAFDPWTAGALDVLNSHPSNEAIAIKVVAPDGFNEACSARMEYIKQAKTSVYALKAFAKRQDMLNDFVIKYDTRVGIQNNGGYVGISTEKSQNDQLSTISEINTDKPTFSSDNIRTNGGKAKEARPSTSKQEAGLPLKRMTRKEDDTDNSEPRSKGNTVTELLLKRARAVRVKKVKATLSELIDRIELQRKRARDDSADEGKPSCTDRTTEAGLPKRVESGKAIITKTPKHVRGAEGKTPYKRVKLSLNVSPLRSGLTVEFIQLGQRLLGTFTSTLTPNMLHSIHEDDLSSDVLMIFLRKMAQFIPHKRLRVLDPNFYQDAVKKASTAEWRRFMRVENTPIVCLPVFDNKRWVLAVIVSTEAHVIVNYLDPQNPDGYVLPVCSRIAQYIDAAYTSNDILPASTSKPIVVSKAIATTPASHAASSGVHVVSYFAAIVGSLQANATDSNQTRGRLIAGASYTRIFSRDQLAEEIKNTWMDAMEPTACWGRRETGVWRPCVRLNLRKSTINPSRSAADGVEEVAVLYLIDGQEEVQWLAARDVQPLGAIQESRLVSQAELTSEEAEAMKPLYHLCRG